MSRDTSDNAPAGCTQQRMDRRKRQRFPAKWDVQIFTSMRDVIYARTVDVSSSGLYCHSPRPLLPGDRIKALLDMPDIVGDQESALVLECDVRVLRVDALDNGAWGIACQILDYCPILRTRRDGRSRLGSTIPEK